VTTVSIFAIQVVLLAWAAWTNRHALNTDAIAYLRLAGYYAHGQTHLMISGYWGPLLSWLIAPLLVLGVEPLLAGRIVMAGSALLFSFGAKTLFRKVNLPRSAVLAGSALVALASVSWSVEYISPDLLVAAWLLLAFGQTVSSRWLTSPRAAALAGLFWGLAYLAKAVALPLAGAMSATSAGLWWLAEPARRGAVARRLALTWLVCGLVAAPWIAVISLNYGHVTFSTSGRIAHDVVGPPDVERYHPFAVTFHRPETGRITAWEDPSRMAYRDWSPFANARYFRHQLDLIVANARTVLALLGGFDLLWLGPLAVAAGLAVLWFQRHALADHRWCWTAVPLVLLAGIYLPVSVLPTDQRYFYAAYPLMLACVSGAGGWLFTRGQPRAAAVRLALVGGGFVSFAAPVLLSLALALPGWPNSAAAVARDLATRLEHANIRGPVAGSATILGGRTGLYLAFLINEPWFGDEPAAAAARYLASGAELIVVRRHQPVTAELDRAAGCRDLDPALFASPDEAARFPLKVYRVAAK
jgi:hypothetical protein